MDIKNNLSDYSNKKKKKKQKNCQFKASVYVKGRNI